MPGSANDPDALLAAGRTKLAAGETLNALLLLRRACASLPASAEAFFLLGAAHHRANQLPAALAAFDRAVALDAAQLQAAVGALAVLCQLGRADEARDRAESLAARHPEDSDVRFTAALVHEALGDFAAAIACYDATLRARPDHREALLNRGAALTRLQQPEAARENNVRLVAAHPGWAEAHYNLAETCLALSRYDDALSASERALALAPTHAGAQRDRGLALAALGRLDEAQAALDRARARLAPDAATDEAFDARIVHLVRAYGRLESCEWQDHDALRRRFAALAEDDAGPALGGVSLAFPAMILGLPLAAQLRLARATAQRYASPVAAGPRALGEPARVRIGYVSSDFRDHPLAHIMAPLVARHDRHRVEVVGYALNPDDGSDHRRRVAAACDRFVDVTGLPTAEIAAMVAQDRIDVLVNLDGYTEGHRTGLFGMRPAPVQASYFGYPATMGAPYIDYLIADRIVVPERDLAGYSEAIAWLPQCYFAADPDEHVPEAPSRTEAGLPADGAVLCDFNQHVKITPEVFAVWMRILGGTPGSVLWLLAGRGDANLRRHAEAVGIDPRRLVFAPRLSRPAHLARLQLADLFLDTRPCNAHTTAADALRAGVPVLTCPGTTFAGRVAASLAHAAGLDALVVHDLAEYEAMAVAVVTDPERLQALKRHLVGGRSTLPVFDVTARARALEDAYAAMVDRQRRGLSPGAIGAGGGA